VLKLYQKIVWRRCARSRALYSWSSIGTLVKINKHKTKVLCAILIELWRRK